MEAASTTNRSRVGDILAALRRKRELNQSELARQLELSQAYISKLEAGGVNFDRLPLATVEKLARVLKFEVTEWSSILSGRMPQENKQRANAAAENTDLKRVYEDHKEVAVYALQSLADPLAQPVEYSHFRVARGDHAEFTRAALVLNNDMERPGRSIHEDDIVFLRTDQTEPVTDQVYAVIHQGQVMLRRFVRTPIGAAWAADNPLLASQLLPPESVTVLGHVYRVFSDFNNYGN